MRTMTMRGSGSNRRRRHSVNGWPAQASMPRSMNSSWRTLKRMMPFAMSSGAYHPIFWCWGLVGTAGSDARYSAASRAVFWRRREQICWSCRIDGAPCTGRLVTFGAPHQLARWVILIRNAIADRASCLAPNKAGVRSGIRQTTTNTGGTRAHYTRGAGLVVVIGITPFSGAVDVHTLDEVHGLASCCKWSG